MKNYHLRRAVLRRRGGWLAMLAAVLLLTVGSAPCAAAETSGAEGTIIRMNASAIQYLGRWDVRSDGTCTGYFQSTLRFRFTGKSLTVVLGNQRQIAVKIDGGQIKAYSPNSSGAVVLADKSLNDGVHSVDIYIKNKDSCPIFQSILLDAGAKLQLPTDLPTIEFIGDSITEGYIGSGYDNGVSSSYAFLTGEKLGYAHNTVAYGGITLVAGYGSPDTTGMISRYFMTSERSTGGPDTTAWDTSRYTPDYLVINLGTNDATFKVAASKFYLSYIDFLERLRENYKDSVIFVMSPLGGQYKDIVRSVVESIHNVGDLKTVLVDSSSWITADQTVDGTHPSPNAHQIVANKLADVIANYTPSNATTTTTRAATSPYDTSKEEATATATASRTPAIGGGSQKTTTSNQTATAGTSTEAEGSTTETILSAGESDDAPTTTEARSSDSKSASEPGFLPWFIGALALVLVSGGAFIVVLWKNGWKLPKKKGGG